MKLPFFKKEKTAPAPCPKTPPRARRQIACCVLLAALAALAPAGIFAVTDTARFGRVQTLPDAYVSKTPALEDYYLVRTLHARREGRLSGMAGQSSSGQVYIGSRSDRSQMQQSSELGEQALTLLESMEQAGALSKGWLKAFRRLTEVDPANIYNFYGSTDSLGFMTITYYDYIWSDDLLEYYDLPLFSMVVDTHTEAVVSLWIASEWELAPPDAKQALSAWMNLLALDTLGDWAVPTGTFYENTGLYSARGELLATCSQHFAETKLAGQTISRWYFCMMLTPYDSCAMASARLAEGIAPQEGAPFTVGELWPLKEACNTGSAYYEVAPAAADTDNTGLITVVDYLSAQQRLFCRIAGCPHDSDACPSYLPLFEERRIFRLGNTVYLCYSSIPGEMEQRYSDNPRQPSSIIDVAPADGTSRRRLATIEEVGITWFACDGNALYGYTSKYQSYITQYTLYRVELLTGACSQIGTLYNEYPLGVWGRYLITDRTACSQDLTAAQVDGSYDLYDILLADSCTEFDLYDLATGQRQKLYDSPNPNSLTEILPAGGQLYRFTSYYDNFYNYLSGGLYSVPPGGSPAEDYTSLLPSSSSFLSTDTPPLAPITAPSSMPYLLLSCYQGSSRGLYLIRPDTRQCYRITQRGRYTEALPVAYTSDGRFLVPLQSEACDPCDPMIVYGLISAEEFCTGSTRYQMVENLPAG